MNFPILEISYKWNHTVFVLLWLSYFTYHDVFKDYLCCSMSSFTWLSNIPFHVYTTSFIYLSLDGHLKYFYLLTPTITEAIAKVTHKEQRGWGINNKETMNITVDATVTFWTVFSNIAEYWSKYMNAWLYTIRGTSHFSAMSGNWCNISFLLKKKYPWFEWRPGNKWFPVM